MRVVFTLIASSILATSSASAQGWIEPRPDVVRAFGVVKVRTNVSVRVTGRIAQVEVEEWFRNDGRGLGEGDYLYPLPGEAVFSNFSLFQGDQELRGETMSADEARRIYEEIVRRKKDPALIELAGHGLLRSRVFPINPGETRKITLRYTQVLERAGDALQFRHAVGSRNGGWVRPVEGAIRPERLPETAPLTFTLTAQDGAAFRDPFSPTHRVQVTREDGRLRVRPEGTLSGDFALFLPLARDVVGLTLATHRPAGEDGYFMLTLSPGAAAGATLPRDITVVLDVSGSMSGSKLDQAKAALRQLLGSLSGRDRFRLLTFNNGIQVYRPDWTAATGGELGTARRWVDGISAGGGTNISGALDEAFGGDSPEGRLPIVVFVTDGLPSVGERDPERIAAQAEGSRGRTRVFAFGVGHDVNTYLLDRLSAAGRGTTQYVQPGEDVEQALSVLAAKIQHPVLADLAIGDAPVELREVYPRTLPDLFAGEELIVFGRYRGSRDGEIEVTGRRGGRTERFGARASFAEHQLGNDYIPRLWASRKIGELTRAIRLEGHTAALEREIRETALRYGLLSEYTSYLVQEPLEVADRMQRQQLRAPAPAASVGAAAVAASEMARARREAKTVSDVAALDEVVVTGYAGPRGPGAGRHVAGRWFYERDAVWVDALHGDSLQTVEIEPFSPAYFRLLQLVPELKPYLSAFEQVQIAGQRVSFRVAPGGRSVIGEAELGRLVRGFRG